MHQHSVFVFFLHKKGILTPPWPYTRNCDATQPHSYLSQGIHLNNKNTHFKEIRG